MLTDGHGRRAVTDNGDSQIQKGGKNSQVEPGRRKPAPPPLPLKMRAAALSIIGAVLAAAETPGYGPEPWLSGNPMATPAAVVTSVNGTARFTVLSSALVRMEWSAHGGWEDARTLVVWNRALPAPQFSVSIDGRTTTITTSAMRLVHVDDGAPLSPDNLYVDLLAPAFSPNAARMWTPALSVSTDPGQLFGTFHTLDDGFQPSSAGLNCSLLDPNNDSGGAADFFPCGGWCSTRRCNACVPIRVYFLPSIVFFVISDFGLLSTSGWSLVDDSKCVRMLPASRHAVQSCCVFIDTLCCRRSPVWDDASGWLKTQDKSECAPADASSRPCFPGAMVAH